jgi:hypothetical protein
MLARRLAAIASGQRMYDVNTCLGFHRRTVAWSNRSLTLACGDLEAAMFKAPALDAQSSFLMPTV